MKVLVTGHRGFVGRHICRKYGTHDITGIDLSDGIDARDFFRTDDRRFDLVVHLAAIVGGRATIEGAPLSVAVDLSLDAEMFNWALRTRPAHIVYFSSSAAYPIRLQRGDLRPLTESDIDLNDIANPDLTYGWAKLTGEYLAMHAEQEGLRVNVFRPFSGYAADQDLSYPFPSFIQRGISRKDPFPIWGDGEQVRDFIHVSDVVDAVDAALHAGVTGPVNLGLGRPTSFNVLARMVADEVGYHPTLQHDLAAPVGVRYRVCDPTKMLSFYTPKVSLEEGIRLAIRQL